MAGAKFRAVRRPLSLIARVPLGLVQRHLQIPAAPVTGVESLWFPQVRNDCYLMGSSSLTKIGYEDAVSAARLPVNSAAWHS